jgi:hypothetical protein
MVRFIAPLLAGMASAAVHRRSVTEDIQNIVHQCSDGNGDMTIQFEYPAHEVTLADVMVGSCEIDSANIVSDGNTHTITSSHPWACGVEDNRDSSVSSYGYEIDFVFSAVKTSNGVEIIHDSYRKTVACAYEDNYSASYEFEQGDIDMGDSDDGEIDAGSFSFELKAMDSTYTTEADPTVTLAAGSMAYLMIVPSDNYDASQFTYRAKRCVIDEANAGMSFELFNQNPDSGDAVCTNDQLFLSISASGDNVHISYMIFLFNSDIEQGNYSATCDIELCMANPSSGSSECQIIDSNCEQEGSA